MQKTISSFTASQAILYQNSSRLWQAVLLTCNVSFKGKIFLRAHIKNLYIPHLSQILTYDREWYKNAAVHKEKKKNLSEASSCHLLKLDTLWPLLPALARYRCDHAWTVSTLCTAVFLPLPLINTDLDLESSVSNKINACEWSDLSKIQQWRSYCTKTFRVSS